MVWTPCGRGQLHLIRSARCEIAGDLAGYLGFPLACGAGQLENGAVEYPSPRRRGLLEYVVECCQAHLEGKAPPSLLPEVGSQLEVA
jgi:hypothetical protein